MSDQAAIAERAPLMTHTVTGWLQHDGQLDTTCHAAADICASGPITNANGSTHPGWWIWLDGSFLECDPPGQPDWPIYLQEDSDGRKSDCHSHL